MDRQRERRYKVKLYNTCMEVQNNTLNISLATNNILKSILTQTDNKNLSSILKNNISIQDIIKNLFIDLKNGTKYNITVENILKNSVVFKNFDSFSKSILSLINELKSHSRFNKYKPLLESFSKNIKDLDEKSLKELINKSGIFLESKILKQNNNQNLLNNINNDIKTLLLKMKQEISSNPNIKTQEISKQIDKLLFQIDYYQLLSITSNSHYLYIPFLWDILEDGNIYIKQVKKNKFYCQINLCLKDYGQTNLLLTLYDKNKLDLRINTSQDNFKILVQKNIQTLKQAFNNTNLVLTNVQVSSLDIKKKENKSDIYKQNDNLEFGFNIKA